MSCFVPTNMILVADMLLPNLIAYLSTVTTYCAIAVGLNQSVPRLKVSSSIKPLCMKLVPFTAVAAAGTVNVFIMRGKEVRDGIHVFTEEEEQVGKPKQAGLSALEKSEFIKARPKLVIPLNLGLIALCLITALPAAIAVFPQAGELQTESMEKKFQDLNDSHGNHQVVF
ncbi:hypothetical protein HPULCUR_010186 [Helicostylum pulchrum]|uniref:Uncharacterized protein n=1 Tax=Helicostylum pulchrum TaxID=562976 RepID=A0ABP9YDL3_9FUNG